MSENPTTEEIAARNKHAAFMRGFKHGATMADMDEKHLAHPTLSEAYTAGFAGGARSRRHAVECASQLYGYRPSLLRSGGQR